MHDTHRTTITHTDVARAQPRLRPRLRPRLLDALFHRWLFVSLLTLGVQIACGLSTSQANENMESTGRMQLSHSGALFDAIQLDAGLQISVRGLLAEMTLKQTFQNTTDQWVEASYLFPLNEQTSVRGLVMQVGDRFIHGKIMPTVAAKQTYSAAKQAGKIASLVEQHRPDLFTAKVANVAPGDKIVVTLSLMMPVTVDQQRLQLRLPTTLTPRYNNALSRNPDELHTPFTTSSMSRGPRLDVVLSIDGIEDLARVESATHTLTYQPASIEINDIAMDQDIVIQWPMAMASVTHGKTFVSEHDGQRYVQIMLTPPTLSKSTTLPARELILVIDKSGSMAGVSIQAAREALHFAIDGLSEEDTFNLVAFDDEYEPLFETSMPATAQYKQRARRFTDRLDAEGGTEMRDALTFALSNSGQTNRLKQVVFMTDGSVGYEDALLNTIKRQLGDSRLFTIGIGPAPNAWFLEKAATVGRGLSLKIRDAHDVANSVTRLLTTLSTPVLTDIAVQYPQGHGEIYPDPIPDLYADKPGMWVSRVSHNVKEIVITGKQFGERWSTTLPLETSVTHDTNAPAVAMHWARRKIDSWLDEQRYAADPDLHKPAITELAMATGLVTRYTSFVAVEEQPSKPSHALLARHSVENLVPAGNTMMAVAMPQGAAGADTRAFISLFLALFGIAIIALSRYLGVNKQTTLA